MLLLPAARAGAQGHPWSDRSLTPDRRAELLVGAMTLPEKFQQLVGAPGVVPEIPACYGARHVPGNARLGIPTLRITNGPVGVGQNDCVPPGTPGLPFSALTSRVSAPATALPSGMAVAASFDTAVARRFGDVIGQESRDLALQVLEGPGLNLARVPQGGRNFEYFGEDPFLTGRMAVAEIRAIQDHGVIAMAKHFVANEQETNRFTVNEIIDDRVLRELYLLPFEMAVKEGEVAAVMCSYNSVNGPQACEDRHHLTDVLRGEWGFRGYVQSDFFAAHGTAATVKAGMDHEMPGLEVRMGNVAGPWLTPARLQAALDAGELTRADLDRALRRRYREMFRLGIFDRPVAQSPIDPVRDAAIARAIGEASAVLLKNGAAGGGAGAGRGILPLDARAIRSVALIGKSEYVTKPVSGCCGGSSDVIPLRTVTPLEGLRNALATLRSSATAGMTVVDSANSNLAAAVAAARSADVVIVMAGTLSEEGRDLPGIGLAQGQDSMIATIAAANPRTVVVLKDNASTLLPWIDRVPAVLEAWFPGQEDGDIVARLLFGLATPSGKLPVTFPKRESDLPARTPRQWPGVDSTGSAVPVPGTMLGGGPATVEYSEGLGIGYRWFQANGVEPLFPFGHGLSYTTFRLSGLEVTPAVGGDAPIVVRLTVENTGARRGAEVPQVYLELPRTTGEPPRRLVGFQKVWLDPGEKRTVSIVVDPSSASHPLGYWDGRAGEWRIAEGEYRVHVGTSSADTPLQRTIVVRGAPAAR
jgi:beta-glucosidase